MSFDIGFTGTRRGMTSYQREMVRAALEKAEVGFANHGDCFGSDFQFHKLCLELKIPVVIHPPSDPKHRAYCEGSFLTETPLPYLKRNRNIVNRSALLIATPAEAVHPRSTRGKGTWYTIDFARQSGCKTLVIPPVAPNLERDLQQARSRGFKEGFGR